MEAAVGGPNTGIYAVKNIRGRKFRVQILEYTRPIYEYFQTIFYN